MNRIVGGLLLMLAASAAGLHADTATFTLTDVPAGQAYNGVFSGPYGGTLSGTSLSEFFCLDYTKSSSGGVTYQGITTHPSGQSEDEVAFLTSYLLSQGPPSSDPNFVHNYEGPIQFAIWQIMGTLGGATPDPAAASFVQLAQNAYNSGILTPQYLSNFLIFTPNDPSIQRFITLFQDNQIVVPEPRTILMLAVGIAALWAWKSRRKAVV